MTTSLITALKRHWFLVAMLAVILVGWLAPRLGSPDGLLPVKLVSPLVTGGIFLISGALLPAGALIGTLRQWQLHALVQFVSFVVCPLLCLLTATIGLHCGLDPSISMGLILLGCLPTTISSGVAFTRAAGGNDAAAVISATIGSLVGVLMTPWLIMLLVHSESHISLWKTARTVVLQMLVPIILGQVLRMLIPAGISAARSAMVMTSSVFLLLLIWFAISLTASNHQHLAGGEVVVTLLIVAVLHLVILAIIFKASGAHALRLTRPDRIAATIAASQKSAALGIPLFSLMYAGRPELGLITLPLLIYHPLQLFLAGALTAHWRRWVAEAPVPLAA